MSIFQGRIKPGEKRNPTGVNGRPTWQSRRLNQIRVAEILNEAVKLTKQQLIERCNNPETPALELMICHIIKEAINNGDHTRLNFLFDRLVGKVKEHVEHSTPQATLIKMIDSDQGLLLGHAESEIIDDLKENIIDETQSDTKNNSNMGDV